MAIPRNQLTLESPDDRPEGSSAKWVIAIAASAGGLDAIAQTLEALPPDLQAAVVLLLHLSPNYRSMLTEIFSRYTSLPVKTARAGDWLETSTVYVAPPGSHLLVGAGGKIRLNQTERVNFVRPSADLLFQSLAESYGDRAIAVVLSGTGTDGANGIRAIKSHQGIALAQDQATSEHYGMPAAAADTGLLDYVLPLAAIATTLCRLVSN
ncbi:MAG: chemotaxis protein CheB [Synechococcales bacterium]|nr:chemotaxis protein CheB [Synechococcales bacterium]